MHPCSFSIENQSNTKLFASVREATIMFFDKLRAATLRGCL